MALPLALALLLALPLVAPLVAPLAAQDSTTIAPPAPVMPPRIGEGDRLRIGIGPKESVTGVLLGVQDGSMVVRPDDADTPLAVPLAAIQRLDVSRGRRSWAAKGALVGGVVGASLGALVALGAGCFDCSLDRGELVLVAAGTAGGIGAVTGALVGLSTTSERWDRVPWGSSADGGAGSVGGAGSIGARSMPGTRQRALPRPPARLQLGLSIPF